MIKRRLKRILKTFSFYIINASQKNHQDYKKNHKEEYVFDAIFSIGIDCRPTYYLQKHDLRFCANPLDWMMSYSLDTVVHLYQSGFNDFFIDVEKNQQKNKWFIDVKNDITSYHYPDVGNRNQVFNKKMKNRFEKVNKRLIKADKICFLSNRIENPNALSDFLIKMGNIYSGEITLINIKHNEEIDGIVSPVNSSKKRISERLELIEYEFNDVHPNGSDENFNPEFWYGNVHIWNSIIEKIIIRMRFMS